MLVLTRRKGEEIVINDEIVVTVVRIEGNKVRLGFEAPESVSVRRKEVSKRPILRKRQFAELCIN